MTPLENEALFASVGLEPILDAKPTLHKYQIRKAADLDDDIRKRMLRFVSSDDVTEAADMPAFDFERVLKLVSGAADENGARVLTPEQAQALVARMPDGEMAQDLAIQANKILTWAQPRIPRDAQDGVMGPEVQEPNGSTLADFRRVWQVAADPMTVLADLEDGSLSPDQVETLAELYPELYAEMRQGLSDALSAIAARRGKGWEPGPRKVDLINVLRGQPSTDPDLTAVVQQVYASEAQPQAQPSRARGGRAETVPAATPGQKAAAGSAPNAPM